jgi:hypothetical protein
LINKGSKKKHSDPKHTSLIYKNIAVENHKNFLSLHRYSHLKKLESRLLELCEMSLKETSANTFLYPIPDFNALFMMCHAIIHFPSTLVLRNLCDWTVFLGANKTDVDFTKYNKTLSETGFSNISDAFTSLAVRFLDLNPDSAPNFASDSNLEDKILLDMLNPIVLRKKNPSIWDILKFKVRLLNSRRWKYELVNPKGYSSFLLYSIYYYLLHPELILQFKKVKNGS